MATFMQNLWESIFTPGTTPTLLLATNATFAALQTVLALLLVFSYSVHFAVLSVLCASLWWSINWFAEELRKAEKAEEEAGRLRRRRSGMEEQRPADESSDVGGESTEDGTETEVEGGKGKVRVRGGPQKIQAVMESAAKARAASKAQENAPASKASGVEIRGGPQKYYQYLSDSQDASNESSQEGNIKESHRTASQKSLGDMGESGSVSTDSEWEKVSDR